MPDDYVPTWNGDPASFESFVTACEWYSTGLKDAERKLAASRIWQRLTGAAKSVVKHLNPTDFDSPAGLNKLLAILRDSPLQKLPVPDSFSRLERWTGLRRNQAETIPQLLVREEELFVELQNALKRARADRIKMTTTGVGTGERERDPSVSPSRSPLFTAAQREAREEEETAGHTTAEDGGSPVAEGGFFEDELRGYRLLKAAKLSASERQHILTLTKNSTHFVAVRRALRTLFAEETTEDSRAPHGRRVWWTDAADGWPTYHVEDEAYGDWSPSGWWSEEAGPEVYWGDDWSSAWDDGPDAWLEEWPMESEVEAKDDTSDLGAAPEGERYHEAFALAQEANKTLAEARQAVAKVRAARGYFDPSSIKGSGKGFGGKQSKGKGSTSKSSSTSSSRTTFGPCFICGSPQHGYQQCPDRFSPKGGSGGGMGFSKGKKGKSKGKGYNKGKGGKRPFPVNYAMEYFVDVEQYEDANFDEELGYINVLSLEEDWQPTQINPAKVIVDTGATESVAGIASVARLLDTSPEMEYKVELSDRPVFRFGNGLSQRAVSRLDLRTKAMGLMSFYLLDGTAETTPPLLGGRELRKRCAVIAYHGDFLMHQGPCGQWWYSKLYPLRGQHICLDLNDDGSWIGGLAKVRFGQGPPNPPEKDDSDDEFREDGEEEDDDPDGHGGGRRKKHKNGKPAMAGHAGAVPTAAPEIRDNAAAEGYRTILSYEDEAPVGVWGEQREVPRSDDVDLNPEPDNKASEDSPGPTSGEKKNEPNACVVVDLIEEDKKKEEASSSHEVVPVVRKSRSRSREKHDDETGDDGSGGRVFMLSHVGPLEQPKDDVSVAVKISSISQRLASLRDSLHGGGNSSCSCSGRRSSTRRMALLCGSHSRQPQGESARSLGVMQAVRIEDELRGQGANGGPVSVLGSPTGDDCCGTGGAEGELFGHGDEREDLCRQAAGTTWSHLGGQSRTWHDPGECEGQREAWTSPSGRDNSGSHGSSKGQDEAKGEAGTYYEIDDNAANSLDYDTNVDGYKERFPAEKPSDDRSDGDGFKHGGGGRGLGRVPDESFLNTSSDCTGRWGMNGLWKALQGLKARMSVSSASLDQQDEADPNPTTIPQVSNQHVTTPTRTTTTTDTTKDIFSVQNCCTKQVMPTLAKRLARAATLATLVLHPVKELVKELEVKVDLVEIACAPASTLTETFAKEEFRCLRVNHLSGYDLDTKKGTMRLKETLQSTPTRLAWVSMPCTRLSALQNLTPRDEFQMARFLKKRGQDLRRSEEVVDGLDPVLSHGGDLAWEWPTTAVAGWKSRAIRKLEKLVKKYNRTLYWIRIDGCQYGVMWKGEFIKKQWTIATTSRELWLQLNKRCDGGHSHAECRGPAAQSSSFYPPKMCQTVLKAMKFQWSKQEDGLVELVENNLLEVPSEEQQEPSHDQQIYALSRSRLDVEEAPKGKRLEAIKQMMMRVHRSAGHPGFSNLQRLLEARGSPRWAVELAGTLECPECKEASNPKPAPPASTGEPAQLWEILGTDVFEIENEPEKRKYTFIIWRDRASGMTMMDLLHRHEGLEKWSPKTEDVVKSLAKWMAHYPPPQWVVADSATYFTSVEFMNYLGRSGVGLTIAPGEAHWIMGAEEQAIGVAKRTFLKIQKEFPKYDIETIFLMVAHAMNSHVGSSGFSAFQWAHGKDHYQESLPMGLDAKKAFGGMLKAREKIRVEYEKELAREKFSKLNNAIGRPTQLFKTGQLVMLWRQKVRPGKTKGDWTGPLRLILVEGSTVWLASGANLVRAKMNQIRHVSRREELSAVLEGAAVYRSPVTVDTLLRNFSGRHYMDVSGDVPSEQRMQENLEPTEVRLPSRQEPRSDGWIIREEESGRVLVRLHRLPRLNLFSPTPSTACPVRIEELTGSRVTLVRPLHGGPEVRIEDQLDVQKTLAERWTGETQFELQSQPPPVKVRRSVPAGRSSQGTKRKVEDQPDSNLQQPASLPRGETSTTR